MGETRIKIESHVGPDEETPEADVEIQWAEKIQSPAQRLCVATPALLQAAVSALRQLVDLRRAANRETGMAHAMGPLAIRFSLNAAQRLQGQAAALVSALQKELNRGT